MKNLLLNKAINLFFIVTPSLLVNIGIWGKSEEYQDTIIKVKR